MNGFLLKEGVLTVEDQIWGLEPFKKILKRDKSRNKDLALKEMLFIYYYTDIKSDYLIIDIKLRTDEIIKDARTKGFSELIKRRFVLGSYILQRENQEKLFLNAYRVR